MADYIVFLAATAAVLPLLIGTWMGHIPKKYLSGWIVSISSITLLLALAVRFIEHRLDPFQRVLISIAFGMIWIAVGLHLGRIEKQTGTGVSLPAAQARRAISAMFVFFGLLWMGISAYQFF